MVMQAKYVLCAGFAVLGAVLLRDAFPAVLSFRQDPTPRKVEGFESKEEKLPHGARVKRHSDYSLDTGTSASSFEQTSGWQEALDEKMKALVVERDKVWALVTSEATRENKLGDLKALISAEEEALGLFRLIKEFKKKQDAETEASNIYFQRKDELRGVIEADHNRASFNDKREKHDHWKQAEASRDEAKKQLKEKGIDIPDDKATEAYNYAASKIQDYTKWYFKADNQETLAALNELRQALGFPAFGAQKDASPEPPKDAVALPEDAADLEGWPEPGRKERLALKKKVDDARAAWNALDSDDDSYWEEKQYDEAIAAYNEKEKEYKQWIMDGEKVKKLMAAGAGADFIKLAKLEQDWLQKKTDWGVAQGKFGGLSPEAGRLGNEVGKAHTAMEKQKNAMQKKAM